MIRRCRSVSLSLVNPVVYLLFAFVAAVAVPGAASQAADPENAATSADIELRDLRPGVWVHTSYYTYPGGGRLPSNGLVVRDGDGLLLVDTAWGELLTLALLEQIESKIGLPVHHAIVTHSHYDRGAGTDVLEARGVEVYAHPLARRRMLGQGMPVPDDTLAGLDTPGAAVRLGPVEAFYPGPGHSPGNLMVWVPSERTLFAGCAARDAGSDSLGGIADADLQAWPEALRRARSRYAEADVVVPGHGEEGGVALLDHTLGLFEQTEKGGKP